VANFSTCAIGIGADLKTHLPVPHLGILGMGQDYPLVNMQKTMDNSTMLGKSTIDLGWVRFSPVILIGFWENFTEFLHP
jgi:hypothetical protein